MNIYKIRLSETVGLATDRWLIRATTLLAAVLKAEQKRKTKSDYKTGWEITSVEEIGQLD